MRKPIIGLAFVLSIASTAMAANSDKTLNVQGIVRDSAGSLQSTPVDLVVSLYASSAAATSFYTQTLTNVAVENGFFTVELAGAGLDFTAMPDAWIGVRVSTDVAELPRQHLDAAPYAFTSGSADSLSSACVGCVTDAMVASGIAASKITGKVASATMADSATTATNATNATNATTATSANDSAMLGGVAAASWQRALTPVSCPANQAYNAIAGNGTATCTSTIANATSATNATNASNVPFSGVSGLPAACTGNTNFLQGYGAGNTAICTALPFTMTGGNNGSANTIARGDHTHPGVGVGWVKIYDQKISGNTAGIPITPGNTNVGSVIRVVFTGTVFGNGVTPVRILIQTSGGGSSNYNNTFISEGAVSATEAEGTGFWAGRSSNLSSTSNFISFDYEISEPSSLVGALGHGISSSHMDGAAATLVGHAGANNEYFTFSSSISVVFVNEGANPPSGRLTVLQLL
jgi:hypothetical protein